MYETADNFEYTMMAYYEHLVENSHLLQRVLGTKHLMILEYSMMAYCEHLPCKLLHERQLTLYKSYSVPPTASTHFLLCMPSIMLPHHDQ